MEASRNRVCRTTSDATCECSDERISPPLKSAAVTLHTLPPRPRSKDSGCDCRASSKASLAATPKVRVKLFFSRFVESIYPIRELACTAAFGEYRNFKRPFSRILNLSDDRQAVKRARNLYKPMAHATSQTISALRNFEGSV